jgi:spore germination cell wall hydrolase CwlJ-like protein
MNTSPRKALLITRDERDIAIRTLYGEARGESRESRVAVAWVIRNRVEIDLGRDGKPDWWGEGVIGVCCKPGQFSCWNAGDPNLAKIKALRPDDPTYRMLGAIVDAVFAGDVPDPTWGSTHYHTASVIPKWARGLRSVTTIGGHLFYNDVP